MADFQLALNKTLKSEGAYNPKDTNGYEAFAGINRKYHADAPLFTTIDALKAKGASKELIERTVRSKHSDEIASIYKDNYWSKMNLDHVSDQRIAEQMFDFSVTSGVETAAKQMQRVAGVTEDGVIGSISLGAINGAGKDLHSSYAKSRARYYNNLSKKDPEKFNKDVNKSLLNRVSGASPMFIAGDDIAFGSEYQNLVDAQHNTWAINEGKIANASMYDKTKAAWSNAWMSSSPYEVATWFDKQDFGIPEQADWKEMVSKDENVEALMSAYNLDSSFYNSIKKTTSENHFLRLTDTIQTERDKHEFIGSTIGKGVQGASAVVGALVLSPENLLLPTAIPLKASMVIGRAGAKYANAVRASEALTNNILSADHATEAFQAYAKAQYVSTVAATKKMAYTAGGALALTVPTTRYIINDHYGLDDMALDMAMYGAVDIGFLNRQMRTGNLENLGRVNQIRQTFKEEREAFFAKMDNDATMAMVNDAEALKTYKQWLADGTLESMRGRAAEVVGELLKARSIYRATKSEADLIAYEGAKAELSKLHADIKIAESVISKSDELEISKWLDEVGVKGKNFVYPSTVDFMDDAIKQAKVIHPDLMKHLPSEQVSAEILNDLKKFGINTDELFKHGKVSAQVVLDKEGNAILKGTKSGAKLNGNVPLAIALSIIGVEGSVLADDGKGGAAFNVVSMAAIGALAYLAWYRVKANAFRDDMKFFDKAKEMVTSGYSSIAKDPVTGKHLPVSDTLSNAIDSLRSNFTETFKPLQDVGGKTKEIAEKLLRNSDDGGLFNAEQFKKMITRRAMSFWDDEERVLDEAYAKYLKENDISAVDRMNNLLFDNVWKSDMRKKASFCIKNPSQCKDPTAAHIASVFKRGMDEMGAWLEEAGVDGFSRVKNYFPRIWQNQNLRLIIIKTGGIEGEGYKLIKDRLTKMLSAGGTPEEKIAAIVEERMQGVMISDRLIRGKANSELLDDIFNRLKKRYELDESVFEPFEVSIDGTKRTISVEDFFELDAKAIYEQYLNEASGHLALAKVGYKNYTHLFDDIQENVPDLRHQQILNENVDLILGRSVLDYSKDGVKVAMAAKNLSAAVMLPLATFNMISEYTKIAFKTGANGTAIRMLLDKISFGILDHGLDSQFVKSIADYHGEGKDAIVQTMKFRGYFDPVHSSSMASHNALDDVVVASSRLRDGLMLYNGMAKATDFGRLVSLNTNVNILARWLNGEHVIHPTDMKVWGISENTRKILSDKIKLNEKGFAKAYDPNKWDTATQDEYMKVINNMMQTDFQEHTLGGTGHYLRNTSVGLAFGALMGFPMQSIVTHAVRDTKGMAHARLESYASTMMWFAGGYATYHVKAMLQGKDPDNEEAIQYAVKMLPLTSPYSVVQSLGDPVAASTFNNMIGAPMETVNILNDMVAPK